MISTIRARSHALLLWMHIQYAFCYTCIYIKTSILFIELVVQEIAEETNDTYITGVVADSSSIQIPSELVKKLTEDNELITMASVYYKNMSGLLSGSLLGEIESILVSPVVSASLQCGQNICNTAQVELTNPVVVTLKHSMLTQVDYL